MTLQEAMEAGWGDRAEAFVNWRKKVDHIIFTHIGLTTDDLPDWDFASAFESEMPPEEAAEAIVQENCDEMGFDMEDIW